MKVFAGASIALLAASAQATLVLDISPAASPPAHYPVVHIPGSSNPNASDIASALGITTGQLGGLLYKLSRDTLAEEGSLTGSYSGFYTPPEGTGTATIQWTGPNIADATYLIAKDGTEGSYVWDISAWDGKEDIQVGDVFTGHAFSHVGFYGLAVVPEPSTYLAGTGALLMLGFFSWRRRTSP